MEIKNCGCCNGKAVENECFSIRSEEVFYTISCPICEQETPPCKTKEDAIRVWNDMFPVLF